MTDGFEVTKDSSAFFIPGFTPLDVLLALVVLVVFAQRRNKR